MKTDMSIDFLLRVFKEYRDNDAIIWHDQVFSYKWLLDRVEYWSDRLLLEEVNPGTIVSIEADFSPNSVALFLSLLHGGNVVVPLATAQDTQRDDHMKLAQIEVAIHLKDNDEVSFFRTGVAANHKLLQRLKKSSTPGLVLFTSGSTGKSKAIVHDMLRILDKFKVRRNCLRMITFLLFDHIGGINTMLYILSNGGCMVTVRNRQPDTVLATVEQHQVELLPTSPTFMNLILISEAYKRHNLSSLRKITYGTEPMPETTLNRFHKLLPDIELLQTYGLSEIGILRSKSRKSGSSWMKIGGEGMSTRVINGRLQIKANSAMLGYLNAPSPVTADGWFDTGDAVEIDGEWIKVLGRESEIINVGGQKVFPAEVESAIQQMVGVAEVSVYGESNPITGSIVCATINPVGSVDPKAFGTEVRRYCSDRLPRYMVPMRIQVTDKSQHNTRYKKIRSRPAE